MSGEIAGTHGRKQKRTLQNYCHDKPATKENKLLSGCPLFPTKPDNVPHELLWAIDRAEMFRRYKQRGMLPPFSEFSILDFVCFDAAEEASDTVQAERMKDATKGNKEKKESPLGNVGEIEEGGAFSNWENK